jgi:hypothetical protein
MFVLSVSMAAAACSSPTTPGVSIVAAKPASPSSASSFSYYSQPVTLVVMTGVATGGATPTSTVEVAADAAFTTLVTTQTMPTGATGQVTLTLDHLSPATTYYWRVKTAAGNSPGLYSSQASFTIGPLLVIQAPVPVQPLADTFPHRRPTFTVANATRTGPPPSITYRFDVATDAAFNIVVATQTVPEAAMQTSFTPTTDLTSGTTYYWRAQASDTAKNVTGPYSSAQAFTTVFPEDGSSRYTLAIQAPSYCLTHSIHTGYGTFWGAGWTISHFTFAGTLTVRSDALQFAPDSSLPDQPSSLLGFGRTRNQLAGSILGTQSYPLVGGAPFFNGVIFKGVVGGNSDNRGQFEGTFDGTATLDREGMPNFSVDTCSTSGFTWTLSPR